MDEDTGFAAVTGAVDSGTCTFDELDRGNARAGSPALPNEYRVSILCSGAGAFSGASPLGLRSRAAGRCGCVAEPERSIISPVFAVFCEAGLITFGAGVVKEREAATFVTVAPAFGSAAGLGFDWGVEAATVRSVVVAAADDADDCTGFGWRADAFDPGVVAEDVVDGFDWSVGAEEAAAVAVDRFDCFHWSVGVGDVRDVAGVVDDATTGFDWRVGPAIVRDVAVVAEVAAADFATSVCFVWSGVLKFWDPRGCDGAAATGAACGGFERRRDPVEAGTPAVAFEVETCVVGASVDCEAVWCEDAGRGVFLPCDVLGMERLNGNSGAA